MPPKRRKPETGDAPDAKKVKSGSKISGFEVRWEWENDGGKWTSYAADLTEDLCEAYNAGKKELELGVGDSTKLRIIFTKMVQKNKATGWERRVRCTVRDGADKDYYTWQWEDERKKWNPYNVECTLDIEKAQQAGDTEASIEAMGRNYTIDLNANTQTNDDSGVVKTIARHKSDATEPPSVSNMKAIKEEIKEEPGTSAGKSNWRTAKGKSGGAAAKSGSGKKGRSGGARANAMDEDEEKVKVVTVKGKAPVDTECTAKIGVAHVYTEGKDIYDVMLNQTNVMNNNNKYFIMQLLEDDNKKSYSVWFRWGRVGYSGQNNLVPCGPSLDDAKKTFTKKFSDKTKNDWCDRAKFKKVSGKYDMVEIDYGISGDTTDGPVKKEAKPGAGDVKVPPSKLDKRLQDFIDLICDVKAMEDTVMEMKYDARKAPLGKLTPSQIKAGYAALKKIDTCITNNNFGQALVEACNDFYTRIPHEFGMQRPPLVKTKADVKAKIQLIEALGDIEIAMKIIKQTNANENPIDTHYKGLSCKLEPLDSSDADFKMIEDYLQNTHAKTHNQYKMKVMDIFAADKGFKFKDVGNRMLLWHGSRLTNMVGILSQGLRIAPPEAPVTGYMFGKGVYFADMSSKSANYCFASRSKDTGILLLCEVALGTWNELLAADYKAAELPKGKHSVKGMGAIAPNPAKNFTMDDGTVVPMGKSMDTGVKNPAGYTLNYNEFIVYDTSQIKLRYIVKTKFNFR